MKRHIISTSGHLFFQHVQQWWGKTIRAGRRQANDFSRLVIRVLHYGIRPTVYQGSDLPTTRTNHLLHPGDWYLYDPLSGTPKFLASELEIKQWCSLLRKM